MPGGAHQPPLSYCTRQLLRRSSNHDRETRLLILGLGATISAAQADKKEKFIVNTRFNSDAIVYLNRGNDLLEKGESQGAQKNFEAAIRADPHMWTAYLNRAQIFARQNKWQLALQDCNTAMRLRPGFLRTAILRANVNLHLGNDHESLKDLNAVISLHADDETDACSVQTRRFTARRMPWRTPAWRAG